MSDDNFLSLYLCRSARQVVSETGNTGIFIGEAYWDDNGVNALMDVYIKPTRDAEPFFTQAYIGSLADIPKRRSMFGIELGMIESLLDDESPYIRYHADSFFFFTLLKSSESYRELVDRFGLKDAKKILAALNDVVFLKHTGDPQNKLTEITRRDDFRYAFLRHYSSWFAWNNADTILNGIKQEQFDVMSPVMNIRFQRRNLASAHDITVRFNFDSLLPQRMAVIIGKNGVGKSQTLGEITTALLTNRTHFSVDGDGQRVLVNRLLAFSSAQHQSSPFPSDSDVESRYAIDYRRFLLNDMSGITRASVVRTILELARGKQKLGRKSRWEMFREAITAIDNSGEIALTVGTDDVPITLDMLKKISKANPGKAVLDTYREASETAWLVRYSKGETHPLSSGEGCFLAFAAQVCRHIDNGTLVLIDEPETHLHPQFISQFADLLYNLLEMSGSVAIVATHSVYFVREVNHEQVIVLRQNDKNEVHVDVPILRTLGANVGAISRFVFGQDQQTRQIERIKNTLLEKYRDKGWEALEADYGDVLASELLSALRMAMEDDQ
ncbi:AAA family ATPase [Kosakonia sp. BYX6]|uniref:AAA family ATPase n=1 Tax=Kosakonia calanthes TaxID=3139408 RepID=A0ABZ3B052_9ENTR